MTWKRCRRCSCLISSWPWGWQLPCTFLAPARELPWRRFKTWYASTSGESLLKQLLKQGLWLCHEAVFATQPVCLSGDSDVDAGHPC